MQDMPKLLIFFVLVDICGMLGMLYKGFYYRGDTTQMWADNWFALSAGLVWLGGALCVGYVVYGLMRQ